MTLVVLTGATRGIGQAAALALAREGAEIALVGRDPERVRAVAEEARAAAGGERTSADAGDDRGASASDDLGAGDDRSASAGDDLGAGDGRSASARDDLGAGDGAGSGSGGAVVHEHVADLTLMSEVRSLADELRQRYPHIDVLANNAGALFATRQATSEGFERTFALNHLAPFLLTALLRDQLAGGRVVTTTSDAHQSGRLDLEDLQSERGRYAAMRVYGTTKLCNILFTRELARRAPELHANCFHPGVVRTGFGKNELGIWKVLTTVGGPFFRSPARGARSLVWLALSPEAADLTGEYVQDEKVLQPSAQARDDTLAAALWERSAELVGLSAAVA